MFSNICYYIRVFRGIHNRVEKIAKKQRSLSQEYQFIYIHINFVFKKNEDFLLINGEIINRFDGYRTIIEEKSQALMALSNATERAVSSPVHDSLRARDACAWIMRAHAHASDRENARADTLWLMERRVRRKARGRAMRSTLLLLAPSPHARVCACARFRLITPDHHLIALAVTCLRFARTASLF